MKGSLDELISAMFGKAKRIKCAHEAVQSPDAQNRSGWSHVSLGSAVSADQSRGYTRVFDFTAEVNSTYRIVAETATTPSIRGHAGSSRRLCRNMRSTYGLYRSCSGPILAMCIL